MAISSKKSDVVSFWGLLEIQGLGGLVGDYCVLPEKQLQSKGVSNPNFMQLRSFMKLRASLLQTYPELTGNREMA